jgi:prepilin-type N-terminal cleavage/methylation domain-containing protein
MSAACQIAADQRGFTLIETLVTIIISAVLAVILAQVIANQTDRSYRPIQVINENLALRAVMENIAADCRPGSALPISTIQNLLAGGDYSDGATFTFMGNIPIDVAYNGCVGFDLNSGQEDPAQEDTACVNSNILKVTLQVRGTQHRLTSLFTP